MTTAIKMYAPTKANVVKVFGFFSRSDFVDARVTDAVATASAELAVD